MIRKKAQKKIGKPLRLLTASYLLPVKRLLPSLCPFC
ncbi:Uncharacterised protein [Vibrio cholerae]|nr:Uncharacterised protein [Vibrio cholerae]CSH90792.1 Uncharacterised protein [Vibrio cholerae]